MIAFQTGCTLMDKPCVIAKYTVGSVTAIKPKTKASSITHSTSPIGTHFLLLWLILRLLQNREENIRYSQLGQNLPHKQYCIMANNRELPNLKCSQVPTLHSVV